MTPHDRFVDHLAAGALDSGDQAHSARCPACAALLPATDLPVGDASAYARALDAAHREMVLPARPWWALAGVVAAANALLATAAVISLEAWNWDVSTSPHWLFVAAAALLGALTTLGVGWALAPGRTRLLGALLLAALAPLLVLLAADGHVANEHFLDGASCLWTVLGLSLLPLGGGAWLLTRSAYAPGRALAVGLASGGVGLLVLQFHCVDGARAHLAVFHLLPWAALGGALVLLRRVLRTWSYAP